MTNLFKSLAISIGLALMGGLLVGDALGGWFQEIDHPWYSLPLWGWGIVGGLYYIMTTIILYRLFNRPADERRTGLLLLITVMMVSNEFWNYLFFGLESIVAGLLGLIPFLIYVLLLLMILFRSDRVSAWVLFPYSLWLVYDLFWMYGLWTLNK